MGGTVGRRLEPTLTRRVQEMRREIRRLTVTYIGVPVRRP